MSLQFPHWVRSLVVGGVTEIAVLAPIRKGRVPRERQTFEERARFTIANLNARIQALVPTELSKIPSIHFGRIMFLRPEQYLTHARASDVDVDQDGVPRPMDDYRERPAPPDASFQSWLLVIVTFDGDLKAYFRDIAEILDEDFDTIFDNCLNYPGTENFEEFWAWIRRYQIPVDLFVPASSDLNVAEIKHNAMFMSMFDEFVAKVRSPDGRIVEPIDDLFDEFLRKTQQIPSDFPTPGGIYKPVD